MPSKSSPGPQDIFEPRPEKTSVGAGANADDWTEADQDLRDCKSAEKHGPLSTSYDPRYQMVAPISFEQRTAMRAIAKENGYTLDYVINAAIEHTIEHAG